MVLEIERNHLLLIYKYLLTLMWTVLIVVTTIALVTTGVEYLHQENVEVVQHSRSSHMNLRRM